MCTILSGHLPTYPKLFSHAQSPSRVHELFPCVHWVLLVYTKSSLCLASPPHSHSIFIVCLPHTYRVQPNPADKTIPLTQDYKNLISIWVVQRTAQDYAFFLKCSKKFTAISLWYIETYYQREHWNFWVLNSLYRTRQLTNIQKYKTIVEQTLGGKKTSTTETKSQKSSSQHS